MTSPAESARLQIRPLRADDVKHFDDFRCGDSDDDQDFVDYLRDDAFPAQTLRTVSTYVGIIDVRLAGYVTLLTDAVLLQSKERKKLRTGDVRLSGQGHPVVPALKIAHLAVSSDLQKKGLGEAFLRFALFTAFDISELAGCRLLTLDALPSRVPYYAKRKFELNLDKAYEGKPRVSMRYDIFRQDPPPWASR